MPAVIGFLGYNPLPAPQALGDRVAYARVACGWSRKRLPEESNVDEATVRRVEDNTPRMTRSVLQLMLRTLGIQK
jgi:ribosome-binding protein aMBF1 (putative translation factor)